MHAYLPSGPAIVVNVAVVSLWAWTIGYALGQSEAEAKAARARALAWCQLVVAVMAMDFLSRNEPPGFRMLALIAVALAAVKGVVAVEHRLAGGAPLPLRRWLAFAAWPGMQPRLFARPPAGPLPGARALVVRGALRVLIGLALLALGRLAWTLLHSRLLASAALLAGLSFVLHFGVCNLLAGFWRWRGIPCDALFRAPWRSRSLAEFWGRRWNLAFSEMTALVVYRPVLARLGPGPALLSSFLLSGLLHEMAISLPVRAGFGLPLLYFALHGGLALLEDVLRRRGRGLQGWPGRAWTVFWVVAPLPLLFHRPFLAGVVWPLAGIPAQD